MRSELLGDELAAVLPVIDPEASDSATIDAVVELLVRAGRSVPHALKLMVPEALAGREGVTAAERGFVDFHSLLMEPWDGPAAIAFCDGTLGRRHARPQRPAPRAAGSRPATAGSSAPRRRGRSRSTPPTSSAAAGSNRDDPGRRRRGRRAAGRPRGRAAAGGAPATTPPGTPNAPCTFDELPEAPLPPPRSSPCGERQLAFGYTQEDLRVLVGPLAAAGKEPTGSMGADAALAALSDALALALLLLQAALRPGHQPGDRPGPRGGRDEPRGGARPPRRPARPTAPARASACSLDRPVLTDGELARIRALEHPELRTATLDATWPREDGAGGPRGGARAALRGGGRRGRRGATILSSPTAPPAAGPGPDPGRCSPPPRSTTAWSAPGGGCAPRSSPRPARRARPTTSPAWSASAPRRSTPT